MSEARLLRRVENGVVVVFSDCHYWPGIITTAHRGLVALIPQLRPKLVIANGDILDGARISKHARIGWNHAPKVVEELDAAKERLEEIHNVSWDAELIWTLGNHDARFETFLANQAPEFAGVPGFTLKEHFPFWRPCWSVQINDTTMVKHRWKGGKQATLRNTIEAGVDIVTGHLHSGKTSPYSDYTGTRYGVDCGTMADVDGPQFVNYTEDGPKDWRSGFVVLTYYNGQLLWPEHVEVLSEGRIAFRGQVMEV